MKLSKIFPLLIIGSLVFIQGCQPASTPSITDANSTNPATTSGAANATKEDGYVAAFVMKPEDISAIKAEIQGNGILYSGLLNSKIRTYEVTNTGGEIETGTSQMKFVGKKDGGWNFERKRTGGLTAIMGDDSVRADGKGIYVTGMSMGTMKEPMLELPKDIQVGSTWDVVTSMTAPDGQEVNQTSKFKVTKEETIKTKAGEFKCLLIEVTGGGSSKVAKVTVNAKFWYTETYGPVKMVTELTQNESLKQTYTVELSKL